MDHLLLIDRLFEFSRQIALRVAHHGLSAIGCLYLIALDCLHSIALEVAIRMVPQSAIGVFCQCFCLVHVLFPVLVIGQLNCQWKPHSHDD